MIKTLNTLKVFAFAASAIVLPATVQAADQNSFVHAGATYTYNETVNNGHRVISGKSSDGKTFRLVVGERKVTGTFNGSPVSFSLAEVAPATVAMR